MLKGICHISQIPVRAEPKSSSEMVSQLLYGETYKVLRKENEWFQIAMDFDGYVGWISNASFYDFIEVETVVQTSLHKVGFNNIIPGIPLISSLGSNIPFFEVNDKLKLLDLIKSFVGTPYLWGGRHYSGIDCSGFVQVTYKCIGVNLPRDASQQQKVGKALRFSDIKQGDLVFFQKNEKIGHVGIALNNKEIIHAHGMVRIDKLTKKGIINSATSELTHQYYSAKRVR